MFWHDNPSILILELNQGLGNILDVSRLALCPMYIMNVGNLCRNGHVIFLSQRHETHFIVLVLSLSPVALSPSYWHTQKKKDSQTWYTSHNPPTIQIILWAIESKLCFLVCRAPDCHYLVAFCDRHTTATCKYYVCENSTFFNLSMAVAALL